MLTYLHRNIVFLLFSVSCLTVSPSFGQDNGQIQFNLGKQFYGEGEFDKSSEIFEELYKKSKSEEVYEYLLTSYVSAKMYKAAEKLVEKKNYRVLCQ